MARNTDVFHVTVAGVNPHDVAVELNGEDSPFHDGNAGVYQHIVSENELVGGIVDVWGQEHLSSEQDSYLEDHPNVIDARHFWP